MDVSGIPQRSLRWDSLSSPVDSVFGERAKAVLGLINHPIIFGNVLVHPGDLILGDDDGMVVVERKECEAVLENSIKRTKAEEKKAEQLKTGISSVELNKLDKIFQSLGLVEE